MIQHYEKNKFGHFDHGWLDTYHHFSFADYYDKSRMGFGVLRVVNDDIVKSKEGFGMHPHKDMEIITYVIDGKLSHKDSIGNEGTIARGQIQYMSAGTGIWHSEFNTTADENLRLLQIWILPERNGLAPNYGDYKLEWDQRINNWYNIVSGQMGEGVVRIYQDINIYVSEITEEKTFAVKEGRQAYIINIDGETDINGIPVLGGDSLEVVEEALAFKPQDKSHIMILEMKKA